MEADRVVVHHLDTLDLVEVRDLAAPRGGVEDAVDGVGHVVGGEMLAVVEDRVADEVELPRLRVELAPPRREPRREIAMRVHLHQVIENVVVDLDGGVDGRCRGVELVGLPCQCDIERATVAGFRLRIDVGGPCFSRGERPGRRSAEGEQGRRCGQGLHELTPANMSSDVGLLKGL